jgi:hypothetical protein
MTMKDKDNKRDLFSIGVPFVAGGVVALLIGFSTGMFTATSTSLANVVSARVDERATICFEAVSAYLLTPDGQIQEAAARALLPAQFLIASGDKRTDTRVKEECRKKLVS